MDLLTFLVSVFLSGMVGVIITIWYTQWSAKQQTKLRVLQQLLGNRHDITGQAFTEALNQVFVVFDNSKDVTSAIKQFHSIVTNPDRTTDKVNHALLALIKSVCKDVKIDVSKVDDQFFLRPFNTKNSFEAIPRTRDDIGAVVSHFQSLSLKYQEQLNTTVPNSDQYRQVWDRFQMYTNGAQLLRWVAGDIERLTLPKEDVNSST